MLFFNNYFLIWLQCTLPYTAIALLSKSYNEAARIFQADICCLLDWFSCNRIFIIEPKRSLLCFHNPHKRLTLSRPIYLHDSGSHQCCCSYVPLSSPVNVLVKRFTKKKIVGGLYLRLFTHNSKSALIFA